MKSEREAAFRTVAKAADMAEGKGGGFDAASEAYHVARACMAIVDADRCLQCVEEWSDARVSVGRLWPVSCTPKASILLVDRPSAAAEDALVWSARDGRVQSESRCDVLPLSH